MRPEFRKAYDLSICMLISEELQRERLIAREGRERYANFEKTVGTVGKPIPGIL